MCLYWIFLAVTLWCLGHVLASIFVGVCSVIREEHGAFWDKHTAASIAKQERAADLKWSRRNAAWENR